MRIHHLCPVNIFLLSKAVLKCLFKTHPHINKRCHFSGIVKFTFFSGSLTTIFPRFYSQKHLMNNLLFSSCGRAVEGVALKHSRKLKLVSMSQKITRGDLAVKTRASVKWCQTAILGWFLTYARLQTDSWQAIRRYLYFNFEYISWNLSMQTGVPSG